MIPCPIKYCRHLATTALSLSTHTEALGGDRAPEACGRAQR